MKQIKVYKDKDISKNLLSNKSIGIIGYGNQGRAQALNLKDSGLDVTIGLRVNSKTQDLATKDGFKKIIDIERLVKESDVIEEGQPLAVIEAMKMENIIKSEKKAVIKKVNCKEGDSLEVDQIILEFK